MKKLLLLSLVLFTSIVNTKATHTYGGELTWKCLANGQYQFYMIFYRDCSGIRWPYEDETIEITGQNLPKDVTGSSISSILVKPDSNRWESSRQGNTAPRITDQYGAEIPCASPGSPESNGNVQQFFYKSDPITLDGVPPNGGWKFSWSNLCCRPGDLANVNGSVGGITNTVMLRAFLYPTKNKANVNPCLYSSVEFAEGPTPMFCRGERVVYQNYGDSPEGDSLSYSWGKAVNPPADNPTEVPFYLGYNYDNPTPDSTFDKRNKASKLNPFTGEVEFEIYNDVGIEKYLNVFRVDSWRDGVKLSTVFRELPLTIFSCPVLPNGLKNAPPATKINGKESNEFRINILAGDSVSFPIQFIDKDESGPQNPKQQLTATAYGSQFSQTFSDSSDCAEPPCAFFASNAPAFDKLFNKKVIRERDTLTTVFSWQTGCNHLSNDSTSKSYYFNLLSQDDHAPIPSRNNARLIITVNADNQNNNLNHFDFECVEVIQNNNNTYNRLNWKNTYTENNNFKKLTIYGSDKRDTGFLPLDILTDTLIDSYLQTNNVGSKLRYYFLEKEIENCNGKRILVRSDTIYKFSLEVKDENDQVRLEWNRTNSSNAEGQIDYVVYRNDVAIDTVSNEAFYLDTSAECNSNYTYYVEKKSGLRSCNTRTDNRSIRTTEKVFRADIIRVNQNTLMAKDSGANYSWYNCSLNRSVKVKAFHPKPFSQTFSPFDNGTYAVIVTKDGCKDTSDCVPMYSVGIEETSFQSQFSYYPNPTNGKISILSNGGYQQLNVQLRTITGKLLKEQNFNNSEKIEFEITGQSGFYFIQLTNDKGERANLKVVKQ